MVPYQFWCKQRQHPNKGANQQLTWATDPEKWKFPIKSRVLLSLWRRGETAWSRQLHRLSCSPVLVCISPCFLTSLLPLQKPPVLPGANSAVADSAQKTRAGSWSDRKEWLHWVWWKSADAKAAFSDAMQHAAVAPVITDLAKLFSRQSSSKMANWLSFCLVYLLGSRE